MKATSASSEISANRAFISLTIPNQIQIRWPYNDGDKLPHGCHVIIREDGKCSAVLRIPKPDTFSESWMQELFQRLERLFAKPAPPPPPKRGTSWKQIGEPAIAWHLLDDKTGAILGGIMPFQGEWCVLRAGKDYGWYRDRYDAMKRAQELFS